MVEEETMRAHDAVERLLAGVAERRMSHIVRQSEGFGEVDIQAERASDGARDLRDFNGVGEAITKVIRVAAGEDLRLIAEAPECARMNDAIAVALEVVAERMRRLRIAAPASILDAHREISQHGGSLAFWGCETRPYRVSTWRLWSS